MTVPPSHSGPDQFGPGSGAGGFGYPQAAPYAGQGVPPYGYQYSQNPPSQPLNMYGSPTGLPPEPPHKGKNTVGVIALVVAILGFILGCVPGALILGWILLPIAFILGVVGLIIANKPRRAAVSAVIISIVGTIVSALVFVAVVGDAFEDAFDSGDVTVSEGARDQSKNEGREATAGSSSGGENGSKDHPASLGSTLSSKDWDVVVNSFNSNATDEVLEANSFNDEPSAGNTYAVVNLRLRTRVVIPEMPAI